MCVADEVDTAAFEETVAKAEQEVTRSRRAVDSKGLLKMVTQVLKASKARGDSSSILQAQRGVSVLKVARKYVPWVGEYHLERLWVTLVSRLQDGKMAASLVFDAANEGIDCCEETWAKTWGGPAAAGAVAMVPVSAVPANFSILVNNLFAARGKAAVELLEQATQASDAARQRQEYRDLWQKRWRIVIAAKKWVEYHWQISESQGLYYRVTLGHCLLALARLSPDAELSVSPVREGLKQVARCPNKSNISFLEATAQALFVRAHTEWKDRQEVINGLVAESASLMPDGTREKFSKLREVTSDQFAAFSQAVRSDAVAKAHPQGSIDTHRVLALACWAAMADGGLPFSPASKKNLEYLSNLLLYQGEQLLYVWCQSILFTARSAVAGTERLSSCKSMASGTGSDGAKGACFAALAVAREVLGIGLKDAAALWLGDAQPYFDESETAKVEAAMLQAELRLADDATDARAQDALLQGLRELSLYKESDRLRELITWGRGLLAKAALREMRTEAALCAADEPLAKFFRTDPLLNSPETPRNTFALLHHTFRLLYAHAETLLVRGEAAALDKFLCQAIKVQACNNGSFSAYHAAGLLHRRGQAKVIVRDYPEALECFAHGLELLSCVNPASALDLRLQLSLDKAEAHICVGDVDRASEVLDEAQACILPRFSPGNLCRERSAPWEAVLGDAVGLARIRHLTETRVDGGGGGEFAEFDAAGGGAGVPEAYKAVEAMINARRASVLVEKARILDESGTGDGDLLKGRAKKLVKESILHLKDPREVVQARLAMAEIRRSAGDWNVSRSRTAKGDKSLEIAGKKRVKSDIQSLSAAFDVGGFNRGPRLVTKTVSLQLCYRLGRAFELEGVHYLNAAGGWTLRHQMNGVGTRQLVDPGTFKGDWFQRDGVGGSDCVSNPENYIERLCALLPESFAVVTLSRAPDGSLLVGRLESDCEPILLTVGCSADPLQHCLDQLAATLKQAKEHVTSVDKMRVNESDYKLQWWDARKAFDADIKQVITSLGDEVLEAWRGLLVGQPQSAAIRHKLLELEESVLSSLQELSGLSQATASVDRRLLRLLISSTPRLYDGLREDAVRKIGRGAKGQELYWKQTTSILYEGLKELLGVRAVKLPETLKTQVRAIATDIHESVALIIPPDQPCIRQHVLLVVGSVNQLPWEACSALEGEPVSRIPSLHYLMHKLESTTYGEQLLSRKIDPSKVFYVLNPDGNLNKTEAKFEWFTRKEGWEGKVGGLPGTVQQGHGMGCQPPRDLEEEREWRKRWKEIFRYATASAHVFLYLGHGTGEQFLSTKDIRSFAFDAAPLQRHAAAGPQPGNRTPRSAPHTPKTPKSPALLAQAQRPPLLFSVETPRRLFDDESPDAAAPRTQTRTHSARSGRGKAGAPTPGGGEEIPEQRAVVFLMGCSSGQLTETRGEVDGDGVALAYLAAGSPAVVANLWDVTDGEIDRFTAHLLKSWMADTSSPLVASLHSARSHVRLRYLIGASPVLYGLPINPHLDY